MYDFLKDLGIKDVHYGATNGSTDGWIKTSGEEIISYSPIDGTPIAAIKQASPKEYESIINDAREGFKKWSSIPAPRRGLIIREIGDVLRTYKAPLGKLVTLEMGKILQEGLGEVQEMIDISDFATGLSRQLYGLTMHSERPGHRMYEQWHPLGLAGIITAFNFPVAVWSWNALIAAVCGNAVVWKPSSITPLCAIAVQNILAPVIDRHNIPGVFNCVIGKGSATGNRMALDKRINLLSATGSCAMGRNVGQAVASRLGKSLLELGGNNAIIITEEADIDLAIRATLFGAIGTAGQRCTTTRRIIIHQSVKESFVASLTKAYKQVRIGNPLDEGVLMGPLRDREAVDTMDRAMQTIKQQGGKVIYGGNPVSVSGLENGSYVEPALVEAKSDMPIIQEETFAPILYIISYNTIQEAITIHNSVSQGLSSAIFTNSLQQSELFLSHAGSDCGIANVNIGTSGAEIGGAFGGEKDTGGGRESGSDAWKSYMRRQTNTINWSNQMPLSQGIAFTVD